MSFVTNYKQQQQLTVTTTEHQQNKYLYVY